MLCWQDKWTFATRFAEQRTHSDGLVVQHIKKCKIEVKDLDVEILKFFMKGGFQLSVINRGTVHPGIKVSAELKR